MTNEKSPEGKLFIHVGTSRKRCFSHLWVILPALMVTLSSSLLFAKEKPNIIFIVDATASMWQTVGQHSKIDAVRESMWNVVPSIGTGFAVGMVAFGHRFRGDCQDSEWLYSPSHTQRKPLLQKLETLHPKGTAAIVHSLTTATQVKTNNPIIILIADSDDLCEDNPCQKVRELVQKKPFELNIIGLDTPPGSRDNLRCMAKVTGGQFLNSQDNLTLELALKQVRKHILERFAAAQSRPVSRLTKLRLSFPPVDLSLLHGIQLYRERDEKLIESWDIRHARTVHQLLADHYQLQLQYNSPAHIVKKIPSAKVPLTLQDDKSTTLTFGSLQIKRAPFIKNAIIQEIALAHDLRPFVTLSNGLNASLETPIPLPTGDYQVAFKLLGAPKPMIYIPRLMINPRQSTTINLNSGFAVKRPEYSRLSGWALYPPTGKQPKLEVYALQEGSGHDFPLYETYPVPPGSYRLRLYFHRPYKPVFIQETLDLEENAIKTYDTGM